jgi:hypothetical protein
MRFSKLDDECKTYNWNSELNEMDGTKRNSGQSNGKSRYSLGKVKKMPSQFLGVYMERDTISAENGSDRRLQKQN